MGGGLGWRITQWTRSLFRDLVPPLFGLKSDFITAEEFDIFMPCLPSLVIFCFFPVCPLFAFSTGRLIFIHHQCWEALPFLTIQRQRCIKVLLNCQNGQHLPAPEVYKNQSPISLCFFTSSSLKHNQIQKNPRAHKNTIGNPPPPNPSLEEEFYGHGFFPADRTHFSRRP